MASTVKAPSQPIKHGHTAEILLSVADGRNPGRQRHQLPPRVAGPCRPGGRSHARAGSGNRFEVGRASSKRSGSAKALAQKPTGKPDGAGNFVYGLIYQIRTESEEVCTRYGNPSDCLRRPRSA